jgi:peroxiredoxin
VHAFGIAFEFRGLKDVAARTTFLVDGEGVIRTAWKYETGDVPDIEEWLAAAGELQSSDASG